VTYASSKKDPLVIIPCGRRKMTRAAAAEKLYLGPYFHSCLETALALTAKDSIRILSGKYGLLKLGQVIAPYDQRIDKPGAVALEKIVAQARRQRLLGTHKVIVLAGQAYSNVVLKIWPRAAAPLYRLAGMGRHLARLKRLRGELFSRFPAARRAAGASFSDML